MFLTESSPYSANKLKQVSLIKVAGDSWKFLHLTLSQWLELKVQCLS